MKFDFKYLSVNQIVADPKYPFTLGGLRHLLTLRKENGLSKAIRKIGKRLYIRTDIFDKWIEDQKEDAETLCFTYEKN